MCNGWRTGVSGRIGATTPRPRARSPKVASHGRRWPQPPWFYPDELDIISRIIRISIGKFNEFVDCASAFIVANRRLIEAGASRDPEVIATLFRNMHTLKGNARTFEFTRVTDDRFSC
jgi:hypothetical protein